MGRPIPLRVVVTEEALSVCRRKARERHEKNRRLGLKDWATDPTRTMAIDVEGMVGEWALSTVFPGEQWNTSTANFSVRYDGDVGAFEIRTTTHPTGRLLVYEKDGDGKVFVLARLNRRLAYVDLEGWCYGEEAKRPQYWAGWMKIPCYRVPARDLRPVATLLQRPS